jgi:hypothetical protein
MNVDRDLQVPIFEKWENIVSVSMKALLQKYLLLKHGTPGTPLFTWLVKFRGRDFLATLSLHLLF